MSEFVPEGWKSVKFKDVFNDYKYGPRFSSKDYDDSGNVKTIRGTDVSSVGEIKYQQVPTAKLDRNLVNNNKLCNGDLVMITTADCGVTAVFYEQKIPYIASAYAIRLTPSKDISSEYIKFFMQTFNAKKQVESLVRKGTVANLPGSDVMSLVLKLPPLPEQQKIAAILTSVDEVIEKTQAQINKLKDLKTGMMQELLTRGVGVDGKPHTEFKDSPVGRIPKGWEVLPLLKFALDAKQTFVNGPFGSDLLSSELVDIGVPVIYVRDMKNKSYRHISKVCVTEEKADYLNACNVIFGDVLVAKVGDPPCNSGVYREKKRAVVTQDVIRIRPSKLTCSDFLAYLLNSPLGRKQIEKIEISGTRKRVSLTEFKKLLFPMPSFEEQKVIGSSIKSIDSNVELLLTKLNKLKFYKKALMQDLLTGKVRVKVDSE